MRPRGTVKRMRQAALAPAHSVSHCALVPRRRSLPRCGGAREHHALVLRRRSLPRHGGADRERRMCDTRPDVPSRPSGRNAGAFQRQSWMATHTATAKCDRKYTLHMRAARMARRPRTHATKPFTHPLSCSARNWLCVSVQCSEEKWEDAPRPQSLVRF